eukprot:TRINITY_DN6346_c0_g1_i9.p1 TRINITY_DN6346_c0_g1~~TRINITY_DN6346_c0_g1_i9.p1  ORF type:complete len:694 (+),score=64.38 TRINITY_DN6346_c0_g1_i9:311-2083(+)
MTVMLAAVALAAHWSLRGGPRLMRSDAEVVSVCAFMSGLSSVFTFRFCPVIMGLHPAHVWAIPHNPGGGAGWYLVILSMIGPAVFAPLRTHVGSIHPICTATVFSITSYILDSKLEGVTVLNVVVPATLYIFAAFAIVNSWNREAHRRAKFMALRTQEQLQFAKEAATCLLRMTCDSAIWVSADGQTVLESDRWLDHIMEKPMTGRSLTEFFPRGSTIPGELTRLVCKKSGAAAAVPVSLLPVRLLTGRGVSVSAEMFVVDRRLGSLSSSSFTAPSALTDAMGTMMGIRCRASVGLTEMSSIAGAGSSPAATTRMSSMPPNDSPGPASGPSLLAEQHLALEESLSCSGSQIAPASSSICNVTAEAAIWLPIDAAVLLEVAPKRRKAKRASSLKDGDAIYCLCGSLSNPVLMPVPVALAVASMQEITFCHRVISHAGHKEHNLRATATSGILVQRSTRRLQLLPMAEVAPSDLYEVVAADRDTVATGFSAVRYHVGLHQGEELATALSLTLRRRVLGVLVRTVRDDAALKDDEPFFVITADRSFPDHESAVSADVMSSTSSKTVRTKVTFADGQGREPPSCLAAIEQRIKL